MLIMGLMGYGKRTSFLAGLTVAQISEFSLIFIAMGISLGHVPQDILGLVTLVGIITIAASTYMITYSHQLYSFFAPLLGIFERSGIPREAATDEHTSNHYPVIIFGLGRLGTAISKQLKDQGIKVLGVDFNPGAIKQCHRLGLDCNYGDATDAEFIIELPLKHAQWIVSTIPHLHTGLSSEDNRKTVIQLTRTAGYSGKLAAISQSSVETDELNLLGVELILEPFQDTADRAAHTLFESLNIQGNEQLLGEY
jgi:hypothetical protein